MSLIQRSCNTLQYYTGTQNGVLIIQVSAIQRFVIEVPLYKNPAITLSDYGALVVYMVHDHGGTSDP